MSATVVAVLGGQPNPDGDAKVSGGEDSPPPEARPAAPPYGLGNYRPSFESVDPRSWAWLLASREAP